MDCIKKSPWISYLNTGGCNGCMLEVIALVTPRYDIERFGCMLKPSARQADILLVSGPLTRQSAERLKTVYSQMAKSKKVIAIGSCAISGGLFRNNYNIGKKVEDAVPVDMYVPGCPPRPESIMYGLLKLLKGGHGKKD